MQDRQVADLPLRPVGRPDCHSVLRLQTFSNQRIAEPANCTGILPPVDRDPAGARPEEERGGVRPLRRGALEERGDRFRQAGWLGDRLGCANRRAHAATIRELSGFE